MKSMGLSVLLWCVSGLLARGQQAPQVIETRVGSGVVVEVPEGAARVALADEGLAEVTVLNSREVLLHGRTNGQSTLFVWTDGGTRLEYVVRVRADWSAVAEGVKEVDAGAQVTESADSRTLLLKGKVSDAAQSMKVETRAKEIVATMPEPRPGVVNLLQYADQDPVGEMDRSLFDALQSIDGRIMLRRIHAPRQVLRNPVKPEETVEQGGDSYVLEGRVQTIRDLSKAMYLADRQLGGTGGRIQAADETRIRSQRQQNFGGDIGGGRGGGSGRSLENELIPNGLAAQVARGLVLSSESGRVISFLEVDHLHQILVGIRVYEVDRQKARSLGVNYNIAGDKFAAAVRHVPNSLLNGASSLVPDIKTDTGMVSGGDGGGGNVVGAFVSDSLSVLAAVDLLQEKAVARSVAEPNVLTLTGEEATVVVGGEVPIPTTAVGQVAAVQGFSFQTFGVRLAIRPTLTEDGVVTMEVAPSIVRPVPGLGTEDVPGFEVQTVQTTARVKAGESLLIGGLLTFEEAVEERGIPLLSRIPVLGWLFKWEKKVRVEKELVFVMTPRLIDEAGLQRVVVLPPLESRNHTLNTQLKPQNLKADGIPEVWAEPEPAYPPDPCPDCPPEGDKNPEKAPEAPPASTSAPVKSTADASNPSPKSEERG